MGGFFRRHYAPLVVAALGASLIVLLALNVSPRGKPAYFGPTYRFVVERGWLKMSDGVRLSVTYFKPIPGKSNEKFPVVLEELPYRKDDSSYQRDYPVYSYMARRGIAAARVDVRGTGSSEGRVPVEINSDAKALHATVKRELYQDGNLVKEKSWKDDIARDFQ